MGKTVHVFDYLQSSAEHAPAAVCVLFGDEPFLRQLAKAQLRHDVIGDEDTPYTAFDGSACKWRDVLDEIATVSLFGSGGRRLAMVEEADDFVTKYRDRLEAYIDRPKSSGVLVLIVSTWQSNTRLYRAIDKTGLQIECRSPQKARGKRKVLDEGRLKEWLVLWAATRHEVKLRPAASHQLLELVGPEFGVLEQELSKLALFAGIGGDVTPEMVQDVVGGWRAKTIWDLLDTACDGDAAAALAQLERLLQSGESPVGLFGQISWSLRRFAAATRVFQRAERTGRRIRLGQAMEQAGFRAWPKGIMEKSERQLKQLGRQRAGQLYRWLLEADLALKGSHSAPHRARLVVEKLIVRMARQVAARPAR